MTQTDVFAFDNAGIKPFLFAEIGVEPNGSALTVLSLLARLGDDPWSLAMSWVRLPKQAVIEQLSARIRQAKLSGPVATEPRGIASRLIGLLPEQAPALPVEDTSLGGWSTLPRWARLTVFYCALAVGLAINVVTISDYSTKPPAASVTTAAAHVNPVHVNPAHVNPGHEPGPNVPTE
jgi:hypothetical protein